MDFLIDPDDRPDGERPSLVEQIMLGAIRLSCLPFLALLIVLASLVYGLASLVRHVSTIVGDMRHPQELDRTWNRPIEARDT